jgi:hypothetical protein
MIGHRLGVAPCPFVLIEADLKGAYLDGFFPLKKRDAAHNGSKRFRNLRSIQSVILSEYETVTIRGWMHS